MLPSSRPGTALAVPKPSELDTPDQSLADRLAILEERVEELSALPARISALELQILQFRGEVRTEFSAVRQELRAEIRAGDEETRRYMRVLHEDVIARIALIQEGPRRPRRR